MPEDKRNFRFDAHMAIHKFRTVRRGTNRWGVNRRNNNLAECWQRALPAADGVREKVAYALLNGKRGVKITRSSRLGQPRPRTPCKPRRDEEARRGFARVIEH